MQETGRAVARPEVGQMQLDTKAIRAKIGEENEKAGVVSARPGFLCRSRHSLLPHRSVSKWRQKVKCDVAISCFCLDGATRLAQTNRRHYDYRLHCGCISARRSVDRLAHSTQTGSGKHTGVRSATPCHSKNGSRHCSCTEDAGT